MTFEEMMKKIRDARAEYIYTRRRDFHESFAVIGKKLKISRQECYRILERYFNDVQKESGVKKRID